MVLEDLDPGFYEVEATYSSCNPGWGNVGKLAAGDDATYTITQDDLVDCWGR